MEGICAERIEEVERCVPEGTQTIGHQGLLRSQREVGARKSFVCQDQGHPRQLRLAIVNYVSCATALLNQGEPRRRRPLLWRAFGLRGLPRLAVLVWTFYMTRQWSET